MGVPNPLFRSVNLKRLEDLPIDLVDSQVPDVFFDASQIRIQTFLQQQQTQSGCFCKLHAPTHRESFIFVASHYLPLPNAHSEKVKVKVKMNTVNNVTQQI